MEREREVKEKIVNLTSEALKVIEGRLSGKETNPGMIQESLKVIGLGVKIMHMNQIKELTDRTHALKLMRFLPDEESKQKYMKLTHPQVKQFLLDKPEKGK